MKNINYLRIVLVLFYCSCGQNDNSNIENRLISFSKMKVPSMILYSPIEKYDFKKFDSIWFEINKDPWEMINYLFKFKNDSNYFVIINNSEFRNFFGYLDLRTSYFSAAGSQLIPNNVAALYLINAIYYDNYYFASNKIICDTLSVFYDTTCGLYVRYPCINSEVKPKQIHDYKFNTKTDRIALNLAWAETEKWRSENKGSNMKSIRERVERPLGKTSLFWIGEKGDKVNKRFPHRLISNYSR